MTTPLDPVSTVADFCGMQSVFPGVAPIELWTLTQDLGKHPAGSTLARQTIEGLMKEGTTP